MLVQANLLRAGEGETITLFGNSITIKVAGEATGEAFAVIEYDMAPGFAGPPPHYHAYTDETFYVLEGDVAFQVGQETVTAGPGSSVFVPRGAVHTFGAAGSGGARFLEVVTPARFARYFSALAAAVAAGGRPDPEAMARLYAEYDIIPAEPAAD